MKVGRQQFVGGVLRRDGAPGWGGGEMCRQDGVWSNLRAAHLWPRLNNTIHFLIGNDLMEARELLSGERGTDYLQGLKITSCLLPNAIQHLTYFTSLLGTTSKKNWQFWVVPTTEWPTPTPHQLWSNFHFFLWYFFLL